MSKKYNKICPECKSTNIIPIKYGMPGIEMREDADMGKIKLGGCGIVENAPEWYCNKCEHEF